MLRRFLRWGESHRMSLVSGPPTSSEGRCVRVYAHAESMSLFESDLRFYSNRRIVVISMR